MSVRIKKINIHAFRGIPDLELELNGKSLLLRGENGTGKSSIVDAIEFFFTGKISHLEGVRGLSLQRHGPHINFDVNDVRVEITFNPRNISLSRTFISEPSPPEEFNDYFQTTQKGTFILRRSQILEFIMSQPAERFRTIGSIIGIESLDNIELEMMRLHDELKGKVESKNGEINRLIRELSDVIGINIKENTEVLHVLNKILRDVGLPLIESLEDANKHAEEMLKTIMKTEHINNIRALNEILKTADSTFISQELVNEIESINKKIKYFFSDRRKIELSLADLLEAGKKVIEQEKMDICPLCERKIDRESLLSRINRRLEILQELSDKASEIRIKTISVVDDLKGVTNKLRSIISQIGTFPELSEENEMLQNKLNLLEDCIRKIEFAKDLKNEMPIQEINQLKDEINELGHSISEKCAQLLNNIDLTEREKKVLKIVRLIEQIKNKVKDIVKANSDLQNYQKYAKLAEKIYVTFSDIKKLKVQEIYTAIQEDMQNFYSTLHPNEPHKNIELTLALGRRASTEIKIESFGRRGEDPRALTSEGHLDSLGLCIFLAFVKKFNDNCPLIILDDVVTTIDANHRNRIAELLLREFKDYQLIITTHDGIWYNQLIDFQRAFNMQGNFVNLEIIRWDVNTGPIISPYKPRWERILDKLGSNDKTGAGNECRTYLEWLLKEICEQLEVPIPFKRNGRYTVAELLDPAEKRVKDKLKDGELKDDLLSKFKDLRANVFMGNLLSHDNLEIENLSIEEVRTFCEAVHNLHEAFLCPKCRRFLKYFRDSGIVRCSDLRCESPKKGETR